MSEKDVMNQANTPVKNTFVINRKEYYARKNAVIFQKMGIFD